MKLTSVIMVVDGTSWQVNDVCRHVKCLDGPHHLYTMVFGALIVRTLIHFLPPTSIVRRQGIVCPCACYKNDIFVSRPVFATFTLKVGRGGR
jgi:hypothetical protein